MDYSKKSKSELSALCRERNIKSITGKNLATLISMLNDYDESKLCEEFTNKNTILLTPSLDKDAVTSSDKDVLLAKYWKKTKAFKAIQKKETQFKYYKRMKSCKEVLQLVNLDSKPFGSESEKIIQEIFCLGPRTSSQNDGTRLNKKIEIKTARYWAGKDDCIWQHLEPDYDYEFALFILLDFHGWKVWGIKKSFLMGEMRDKKIVTYQGKQGWWVKKSAIVSYLTPIQNISELDAFIQT
jgi:hypothetical protein